jgi:hypothetical protein
LVSSAHGAVWVESDSQVNSALNPRAKTRCFLEGECVVSMNPRAKTTNVAKRGHELRFFFFVFFLNFVYAGVYSTSSNTQSSIELAKRKSQSCLKNIIIILPFLRRC